MTSSSESFDSCFSLSKKYLMESLDIDDYTYYTSIDNLFRQRLISSYTTMGRFETEVDDSREEHPLYYDFGYLEVCITALGFSFVKACTIID